MSSHINQAQLLPKVTEYTVRVPKNVKKKYHMMRFHNANGVNFKNWNTAKMERENNYKEFKSLDDDQPKYGAGSEFGREQRDEARRKRYGINIKKYKADDQPWLLTVKDKNSGVATDKKFKGIREGGVSDNVAWYVFVQAKDGAFEAYPVEEWYNFQPIHRYKSLNAEEAEKEFERRDKIMNYFSVMYQKKRNEDDEADAEEGSKKKASASKAFQLSEMDDWMSDQDSDDDGDEDAEEKLEKKPKKKGGKPSKFVKKHGGKRRRREDGESGTDCEEESDEYDEGAEHEYVSEDSSDPEHEDDEKVTKEMAGVEDDTAMKKLLNSDDEDDENEENKDEDKEDQDENDDEKNKKKKDSSSDLSDSSDDEKPKNKDPKKGDSAPRNADILKRKIAENPDGLMPASKKQRPEGPVTLAPVLPSDSGMFEDQIRRYLVRKPMTTTEILQKLKSKKTGHGSEQLVDIIAVMLKKINPQKQRVKGKMYLSLKSLNG